MDNENPLINYFISLLEANGSIDMAEAEFKRIIADDEELRDSYREWCSENGYTIRAGFSDFAYEYFNEKDSIWDNLNDYNEDE